MHNAFFFSFAAWNTCLHAHTTMSLELEQGTLHHDIYRGLLIVFLSFLVQLQVNAVYAILVASLVGLGTAASVNSLVVFLAWRNQAPWSQTNISPV